MASGEEGVFEGGHLVIELHLVDVSGELPDAWARLDAEGEEVATEEERGGRGDFDIEIFDSRAEPGDGGGGSEAGRFDAGEEPRLDGQREAAELAVGDGGARLLLFVPAGGEAAMGVESEDLPPDVILPESLQPEAFEEVAWIGHRAAEEREHDDDALRVGEIVSDQEKVSKWGHRQVWGVDPASRPLPYDFDVANQFLRIASIFIGGALVLQLALERWLDNERCHWV